MEDSNFGHYYNTCTVENIFDYADPVYQFLKKPGIYIFIVVHETVYFTLSALSDGLP